MPINLYEGELFYSSGNGHVYLKTGANQGRKAFLSFEQDGIWECLTDTDDNIVTNWQRIAAFTL